jgi:hypothetical protein
MNMRMWRVLKNIYESVESSVLVGEERSDFFNINVGLRQGCILSPILFALFINGLGEKIKKLGLGIKHGKNTVSILMFADDIVLIAENRNDLERLMQVTYEYSIKWRFSFNYDKCSVLIFGGRQSKITMKYGKCVDMCSCGFHWRLGKTLILETCSYKYLGAELDRRLSFVDFKKRIADKAKINRARIWRMGMNTGALSVRASINLWEALVRSILEYGAEVWGGEEWEEAEVIQREMGRRILRCKSKTSNEAVLGELGWWRMKTRRDFIKLKYWINIVLMEESRLVKQIYQSSKAAYQSRWVENWSAAIHRLLLKYNLGHLWNDESIITNLEGIEWEDRTIRGHRKFWVGIIKKKIQEEEEKEWKKAMEDKPKLRTYRTIKNKLELEEYLIANTNREGRYIMTSLRTGSNDLRIETGRRTRPREKIEERLCMECMEGDIEDEKHFLLDCAMYQDMRQRMFDEIRIITADRVRLDEKTKEEQWRILMKGVEGSSRIETYECVKKFLKASNEKKK